MTTQPALKAPKPAKFPRVYKVGVYGRSSSGKTCLLAALVSASSHQNRLTCDLVVAPPGYVAPEGSPEAWDRSARNVQYKLGLDWIQGAIRSLQAGQVPKPNDPDGIYRYLFDFTSSEMPTRRVELTDYAGELVKAGVTPQEVAAQLKNHLKDLDCLLVIAETPRPGNESEQLAAQLTLLRQAFTELKGDLSAEQTVPCPTALIFTKWDRRSGKTVPPAEQLPSQLMEMLNNKTSPLRGLRDVLANSVIKHEDGMFETFVLSALGPCEVVSVSDSADGCQREIERPCSPMPLASFGVQEPFIWLIRRRDRQVLDEWQQRLAWPGVLWRSFWGLWRVRQMNRLRKCYHTDSKEARLIRSLRSRSLVAGILQFAFVFLLATLLITVVEALWDVGRLRTFESTLADNAQFEQWHGCESWLEEYGNSSDFRHSLTRLFFSRDEARNKLQDAHNRHESLLWEPVAKAPDLTSKLGPAEAYVSHFNKPDRPGLHQREAQEIVAQAPWVQEMKKVDSAPTEAAKIALLDGITRKAGFDRSAIFDTATKLHFTLKKSVGERINEEKLTEVANRLAEVKAQGKAAPREQIDQVKVAAYNLPPLPEAESADQRAKRLKVRQAIDDLDVEIIKDTVVAKERKEFNALRAKHDSLLEDGDFTKAAELLTDPSYTYKSSDKSLLKEFAELKEAFPKKATVTLKALIDRDLEAHKFKDAYGSLKRFDDSPSIAKLFRGHGGLEEEWTLLAQRQCSCP